MFFNIRNAHLLAMGGMAAGSSAYSLASNVESNSISSPSATCEFFKATAPNMTVLPSDSNYTAENEVSWNAGAWLGPACVLVPSNGEQLSFAVQNLVRLATPFSMRGGGHMPIPDAANINSTGILISSTNLKTMELSADLETLSIGPGYRWGDAYEYLGSTGTGKMVIGGRYAPVGVPGYLIGGGMSFYSYEYGFSSTNGNVRAFDCVLADGTIAHATVDNEYSDLYWALQGGGNSFCLLFNFDLRTIDSPTIGLAPEATYGFGAATKDAWLDSILSFAINGSSDPKAAIIPVANYAQGFDPTLGPSYDATLFYNGNNSAPAIFSDFQGGNLPASNTTVLLPISLAEFAEIVSPEFEPGGESYGQQQRFHVVSTAATKEAMEIVHDTYFDAVLSFGLANVTGFITGLAYNAITTQFIAASNNGTGCPQGVPEEAVFWVEQSTSWADASDDALIESFVVAVNANITTQLEAINATRGYTYLNDADQGQQVFQTYPAANVQRLKEIRDKYDPDMVFTNLMPGGFKVANA